MSGILKVGGSELINDNGGSGSLQWGTGVPAGSIVQTKFVHFDGVQTIGDGSSTGTTFVNIGLGVSGQEFSIDMSVSSGNKILGFGVIQHSANERYCAIKIYSDSTQIATHGSVVGNRTNVSASSQYNSNVTNDGYILKNLVFQFDHTPSDTSSHTYSVKGGNTYVAGSEFVINKMYNDGDNGVYIHRGYSHFMLMEVAQ